MKGWWRGALGAMALGATVAAQAQAPVLLHTERSSFETIVVYEQGGERCMKFGSVRAAGRQSCQRPEAPERLLFDYTRTMLGALYLKPDPARILVVGLGGGSLPMALARVVPEARIDTVEIDPAVLAVAERFFGFRQGPRQRVHVQDGRAYVQAARARGERYDIVMLDAFDEGYIPPHLLTREFLGEVRDLLAPGGVLAANTFSASGTYADESATYAAVFGTFFNLRGGNRVILAMPAALPDAGTLRGRADRLRGRLEPLGVQTDTLLARFSTRQDWGPDGRVLADPPR